VRRDAVATREAIIEAAARVFQTKGYHAASVQDIADAVGILKGSLYHHFESKEELLYLIVKEPRARLYKTVADIVADDAPAGDKLRRALLAHLEAFAEHYPHLFVYLREREEMKRRFRGAPKEYERYWQQILREGVKSGEFRADLDVDVVSYGLLGMVNWLYKWYDPNGRLSVREIAAQFSTMALAGLTAAERSGKRLVKGGRKREVP
jgi:AcrR family transcriptional regulator